MGAVTVEVEIVDLWEVWDAECECWDWDWEEEEEKEDGLLEEMEAEGGGGGAGWLELRGESRAEGKERAHTCIYRGVRNQFREKKGGGE